MTSTVDSFTATAANWRGNLSQELVAHIAECCCRMDNIHGAIARTRGEVDGDGQVNVEVRLTNFNGDDLIVQASLQITKLVIVPPPTTVTPLTLPTGVGVLDQPPEDVA